MSERRIRDDDQRQWLASSNLALLLFDDNGNRIKEDRRHTPDRRLNNILVEEIDCSAYINGDDIRQAITGALASNDYESTNTIRQRVCDEFGQDVSDKILSGVLIELQSKGDVASYIYDTQSGRFALIISPEEYSTDALCWRLSE